MPPKWQPALRHLPNALSLFRLACGPMLVATHWEARPGTAFCALFVLGGLSDGADGFLARKLDVCSVFGAELDGRADTCFYAAMVVVSLRWYAVELRHQLPTPAAAHRRDGSVAPIAVGGGLREVRAARCLPFGDGQVVGVQPLLRVFRIVCLGRP